MDIQSCVVEDATEILTMYEAAQQLQIKQQTIVWPTFEKSFVEKEIMEGRQWKIMNEQTIACNWAITFEDIEIWEEKDQNDAIYIHRICTNPYMRGNRYIDNIVEWAKPYAVEQGKRFIRLDTLGNNKKLIQHYTSAGFTFLGMFILTNTATLPAHYHKENNCCLFEIDLEENK